VMYAGQIVEVGSRDAVLESPRHPYTSALLAALPERATSKLLPSIPGVVPGQFDRPDGCLFSPRCAFAVQACRIAPPTRAGPDFNDALCIRPLVEGKPSRLEVAA
jgi:dipeptide transport system ATP-binding protein